jgi:hypothetical protein
VALGPIEWILVKNGFSAQKGLVVGGVFSLDPTLDLLEVSCDHETILAGGHLLESRRASKLNDNVVGPKLGVFEE